MCSRAKYVNKLLKSEKKRIKYNPCDVLLKLILSKLCRHYSYVVWIISVRQIIQISKSFFLNYVKWNFK